MKTVLRTIYILIFLALCAAPGAAAFSPDRYAANSVLSHGKWVKISVSASGMHCIPASTLADWGFSDPSRVRVHGYGGAMLPDELVPEDYIDDLPRVASRVTPRGLVFYATGPQQINLDKEKTVSHAVNPYSNFGYYFLTEETSATPAPAKGGTALDSSEGCAWSGKWMAYYDPQELSIGRSGRMMVGEEFKDTRSRDFRLNMPGRVPATGVTLNVSMVAKATTAQSNIRLTYNGTPLPTSGSDNIAKCPADASEYGKMALITKSVSDGGTATAAQVGITLSNSGPVAGAWLNYIEIIYERAFAGSQEFIASQPDVISSGAAGAGRYVWDVTDPRRQYELNVGPGGAWRNERPGIRRYVVWGENDDMPEPAFVGNVGNQNLHDALAAGPDMVIITPGEYLKAANALADIHRNDAAEPLVVEVVRLEQVLNEFGSGAFDPGALRRFLKMRYDRGLAANADRPLRYALMLGKGTCDNRALTAVGQSLRSPMPLWVSENSLSDSYSYSTDDYFALLDDFDGTKPASEDLDIAVGRIPATNLKEANVAVDKIRRYLYSMPTGPWRARMTILADDQNSGAHMDQSELMMKKLMAGSSGPRLIVDKIYCDAYLRQNSTYPIAREDLFRNFNDGMAIFTFVGHGSPTAIGSKNIIQPVDFRDNFYLRRLPFFYAATCSFLKWDVDVASQAEKLMFQSDGGIIGCISALRPVFITKNGTLTESFGKVLGAYDADGCVPTMGELYRLTKNGTGTDDNKLRYVLMADPALRLAFPSNNVTLDAINGVEVTADNPYTIMARQELTITGRVTDSAGRLLDDFDGTVTATFYDAEYSTTSFGYGDEKNPGREVTFEQTGELLFMASGRASKGEYSIKVRMPQNIADNYRPATMSLFASSDRQGDLREAAGASRDLYAFGYDETTPDDSQPPVIHYMTLNDDGFSPGDDVNPSPLLIARLSDNSGLNMSTAGVGQKMTLTVDGTETFNDLAAYFTPDAVPFAGQMSGTLQYPVSNIADGRHTLTLRVWDIDGNFADHEVECNVRSDLAPEIYEVYTDAMPARTEARFFVRHNRPDQIVKVTVSVYDLMGRHVWSGEAEARSDMQTSTPLVWDLRNSGGQRVPRGIYIYRAEISAAESSAASASKKLAVANE